MKIFRREQTSLFGEILDWMLTPLLILWPVSLLLTWAVAQNVAGKPYDRALESNANTIAEYLTVNGSLITLNLPKKAREVLQADEFDQIYFQVVDLGGNVLAGQNSFPKPSDFDSYSDNLMSLPVDGSFELRDDTIKQEPVRVAALWAKPKMWEGPPVLIQVAETREKRAVLATEIIRGAMVPQFVMLPLAVALVWFALVRGIRPLNQLEARIRKRRSDDLSPLDEYSVPSEVAPLVASINDLLARLQDSLISQKRFLANAAHQLKTPLAGLRMQADLALEPSAGADDLRRSLHNIAKASTRATRTVNQLLTLARAESAEHVSATLQQQNVNLPLLLSDCVQDCLSLALAKNIDLGYEGVAVHEINEQIHQPLQGNLILLKELVRNLLENAINYTPEGGIVTARTLYDQSQKRWQIEVEDTGVGIAPEERELVLQPFYRVLGNEADGSGLGLSIVLQIVALHGALLKIVDGSIAANCGVKMTVQFQPFESSAAQ